jgi:hypothetical protein
MMLADAQTFVRCTSIFDPTLFDRKLQKSAEFLQNYVEEHNVLPTPDIINAATGSNFKAQQDLREEHFDWLMGDFETFIKHKGLRESNFRKCRLVGKGRVWSCRRND